MIRNISAALIALALTAPPASAQTTRDSVLDAVHGFFRTMTADDSAGAARVVRRDGVQHGARVAGDSVALFARPAAQYLASLGGGNWARYVERFWDPTVLIRGPLAVVWTPYDIWRDGAFVHCGIDAFTLLREPTGWRISSAAFTMEPEGCAPSPLGPLVRLPALLLGEHTDDYGNRFTIGQQLWLQHPRARYHVAKIDLAGQYLIARNDSTNPSEPGRWSRIDWLPLEGMAPYTWAFCLSAYDAPSAEAAEAVTIAVRATPRTGCNGFPFSRMRPAR